MPLYKRDDSPNWYVRVGRNIDRSTGTPDRATAELILAQYTQQAVNSRVSAVARSIEEDQQRALRKYMQGVLRSAKKRREYSLSEKRETELIGLAAGRCQITNIAFSLDKAPGSHRRPFAPSLDRIDSSQSYTDQNVRVVCCAANYAMNEWGESVLRKLAVGYLQHRFLPIVLDAP